ncbi:hypothetical protein ACS0TY_021556 [Phlomoides rotata]
MFLSILAHHKKNWVVWFNHQRSGQTVSHYVHAILLVVLKMHTILFVRPDPVPEDNTNPIWKWFKGCLGTIDGSYISVHVPEADKGNYYLCDNGYANNPGFLSSYCIVRYHISSGVSKKGSDNTCRAWSQHEEKVFIVALKDLVAKGQKADNGFRTGYLNKLEDALSVRILTAIMEKIKKRRTQNLFTQFVKNDYVWGDRLIGNPEHHVKDHHVAKTLLVNCVDKKIDVFGKDRAIGESAEEVPKAIGEMDGSNPTTNVNNPQESNDDNDFNGEGQFGVNKDPTHGHDEQEENSASQKARGTPRAHATNKKRKSASD